MHIKQCALQKSIITSKHIKQCPHKKLIITEMQYMKTFTRSIQYPGLPHLDRQVFQPVATSTFRHHLIQSSTKVLPYPGPPHQISDII